VEMLQDLVLAACNEATKKVDDETKQKMSASRRDGSASGIVLTALGGAGW